MNLKHTFLALAMAAALAGCSSNVKLDPPVADASATQDAGAAGQSGVAAVDATGAGTGDLAGPPGVSRVVYFDFDSFVVKPEYQSVVEAQARYLNANRNRNVLLQGHTDVRGGSEYNLALGQKRAEAVRRSLGLLGVNDAQLEAVSFGKEKPASAGSSENDHAQNRRVEFSYR